MPSVFMCPTKLADFGTKTNGCAGQVRSLMARTIPSHVELRNAPRDYLPQTMRQFGSQPRRLDYGRTRFKSESRPVARGPPPSLPDVDFDDIWGAGATGPNTYDATSLGYYYKSKEEYKTEKRARMSGSRIRTPDPASDVARVPGSSKPPRARESRTYSKVTWPLILKDPHRWEVVRDLGNRRFNTLKRLGDLLREHYGNFYHPRPFGSTCYGGSNTASDIDVVIYDAERPYGIEPGDKRRLPPIYNVRQLAQLFQQNGFTNVVYRPKAAVPIIKYTDPETNMSCDVNINNRLGVYNTALLRQYCLRSPGLSRCLRIVKAWLDSVGLNNSSVRGQPSSFSSYAITIMTIAFMQYKGYLPNLQADEERIVDTYFYETRHGVTRKAEIRFGPCKDWKPPPYLRPLSYSMWLRFWFSEFDYKNCAVSIREGGIIKRPEVPPPEWGHHLSENHDVGTIVVLDPLTYRDRVNDGGRI
ncbi:hypothetical protein C8Q79DRAFT_657380 [Trametes meyenii]|nr:hypothetical protein C8Q79DRAFT_657380 [Trametes meyenii]